MDWVHRDRGRGVDLERYIVAVGQFGGAIAMTRDPRMAMQAQMPSKPGIDIYSPAGFFETSIPWNVRPRSPAPPPPQTPPHTLGPVFWHDDLAATYAVETALL